jgi:hypothetical protein
MLVTISQSFDTPGRRWNVGDRPDVDPVIARQWIADGKAAAVDSVSAVTGIATARGVCQGGDSIAAYGDNTGSAASGIGATSQSIVSHASSQMPGRGLALVVNRAVGGTRIDNGSNSLIGTQLPLLIADNAPILWLHTGINHLNASLDLTFPTVAEVLNKFRRLLDIASPAKPCVVVDALTPLAIDSISGAAPRRADIPLVNAGLKIICASYKNVIFNDVYTPLAIDSVSGTALPGMTRADDGIHLTTVGAYTAGVVSAANLLAAAQLAPYYRVTYAVPMPAITGTTGTKTPGSGTISGTVSTGYELRIASGTSVVTTSVIDGKQHIAVNNTASGSTTVIQFKFSDQAAQLGTLANGDTVVACGRIEMAAGSSLVRRSNITLQINPAGSVINVDAMSKSGQESGTGVLAPLFPSTAFTQNHQVTPYTIAVALASINLVATVEVDAGGSATFDVSAFGLQRVTVL